MDEHICAYVDFFVARNESDDRRFKNEEAKFSTQ
jgi:hypothetical protein